MGKDAMSRKEVFKKRERERDGEKSIRESATIDPPTKFCQYLLCLWWLTFEDLVFVTRERKLILTMCTILVIDFLESM